MKTILDINVLSEFERDFYLNESWCGNCGEADLGIVEPEIYIESEKKYIVGKCKVCDESTISEIIENEIKE
jgi:hypothetical protein